MSFSNFFRIIGITALCLIAGTQLSAAENNTIRGTVTDSETGRAVTGVNIIIKGTLFGASTDPTGDYVIENIPTGEQTIIISHLGYEQINKIVEVNNGDDLMLDFTLKEGALNLSGVTVQAQRPFSAASSSTVRQFDLKIRPADSAQDMLQLAPGLVIAQHGGGGKAEQIFLRGFDADHGTDVAIYADGMPVNMVSHGHGQGYADLHFIIPEVVESIDVFKGPYFARFGNLSTAGSVSFKTKDHIKGNLVRMEGGEFATSKITTVFQVPSGDEHQNAYFAGQFHNTDGPFESEQGFQRFNLFGKFHTHFSETSRLGLSIGSFSSAWDASGQIPQRAVDNGTISRFGTIDDLEGGTTSRHNVNLEYTTGEANNKFLIQGYASRYNFKLFSNFTFYLEDPINGDMIEQTDQRNILGLNSRYFFRNNLGSTLSQTTFGGGFRADDIQLALWKSPDRVRENALTQADVYERNLFLWAEQEFIFNPMWRLQLGLRADYFTFNVEDRLDTATLDSGLPHASGYSQESIISPKINLVFSPFEVTDFYVNAGSGFHSNDARDVVIAQRMRELRHALQREGMNQVEIDDELAALNFEPEQHAIKTLPRALGAELGIRTHLTDRITLGAAAWWLGLDEELVFVGDGGNTEISGESRRIGLDLEGRVQLTNWLWADADVNIAKGEFVDEPVDANDIPLAPRLTSTGGITAILPNGFDASLRYRHIGDRPANEANTVTAEGYTLLNLSLGYRFGAVRVFSNIENIFDVAWNEAQFDTETQLKNETEPVSEIHFTPGNPRNFQVGLSYEF